MTSNIELIDICNQNGIKLTNVIMSNELKDIKKKKELYLIINLQDINKIGSHWVSLIKRNNQYLYFDSFGVIPDVYILKYKGKHKVGYSNYIIQDMQSVECGIFCIAFLHYIQNNKGKIYDVYNDFINLFEHQTNKNDIILKKYIANNKIIL